MVDSARLSEQFRPYFEGDEPSFQGGYGDLVAAMDVEVLVEEYLGSYQGDILYILKGAQGYGFLPIGYGSCSGCDALQAYAENLEAVIDLARGLEEKVRWFASVESLSAFLHNGQDQELQWYAHETGWREFLAQADGVLGVSGMTTTDERPTLTEQER